MKYELKYRVFIKYCVFSLKCFDFSYVSGIYFTIFEKKTTIFNEHPVFNEHLVYHI